MREREESGDKAAVGRAAQAGQAALLALSAGLYWSWWDSFHELYRFAGLKALNSSPHTFLEGGDGYLQCFMEPLGAIVGCGILIALVYRTPFEASQLCRTPRLLVVLALQALAWLAFCLCLVLSWRAAAGILYSVASALVMPTVLVLALRLRDLDVRSCGLALVGALGCYGFLNNFIYPIFLRDASVAVIGVLYLLLLGAAFLAMRAAVPESRRAIGARVREKPLPPWQLAVHLVAYGAIFGALHILEGWVQAGPYSVNLAVLFGCLIAMAAFCVLFLRRNSDREIWSKMRSTIVPFVTIGYLLIPLARNSDLALSFTEAGMLLYLAMLFFGCITLMHRTSVAPTLIVCWALLLYSAGKMGGITAMAGLSGKLSVSGDGYFLVSVVIVLLLTAATFWVASDEQVRKLWGLRREMEPKRYHDAVTRARVAAFTERCALTPREAEVLRLVAQGRRAPEMVEVMGVSMDTVRTHLKHLYTKMDAHSYAEVVGMMEAEEVPEATVERLASVAIDAER